MAKTFDPARDIVNQTSEINETIQFGGSVLTSSTGEPNIKEFNHWTSGSNSGSFYQAVFSQNHTASTAVELIDITYGQSISSSFLSGNAVATNTIEKNRIYKLFAKQLLGDEKNRFSIDGTARDELIFASIRRSQYKDEIKKDTLSIEMMGSGSIAPDGTTVSFNNFSHDDDNAANKFDDTSRGHVANLKSGSTVVGRVFYQAGVVALIPEKVSNTSSVSTNVGNEWSGSHDYESMVVSGGGGTFENTLHAVRKRFRDITFNNRVNLHSTFYFCRALNDEFNYSSNPSFIDDSNRIVPMSGANNLGTRTYITRIGLLGPNGEVLSVGSLSKPVKKTPEIETVIKVRLDF